MKIDPKKLSDKDLWYYYTHDCEDEELRDLVRLLPFVEADVSKQNDILRNVSNGARLIAVYPAVKQSAPSGATCLGSIPDGTLWVTSSK